MTADERFRAEVLSCAQGWIDTPYQHQAARKYHGTDCLGLIRGIWAELYGSAPEVPPAYTPDWAERCGQETLLHAAQRWLIPLLPDQARAGDVLLFRMQNAAPCKHIGIISGPDTFIHAYWGRAVVESYLVPYWQKRRAFAFAFPHRNDVL